MRLPRFRVRTLMVAVAAVALALCGFSWLIGWTDKADGYRNRAKGYAESEEYCRRRVYSLKYDPTYKHKDEMLRWLAARPYMTLPSKEMLVRPEKWAAYWKSQATQLERTANYYAVLRRKSTEAS